MAAKARAALYLRVSTTRQARNELSIPDQQRQGEAYCALRGYALVEIFSDPGVSATTRRRPEFRRMMEMATNAPPPFDFIVVHSFSRFFRDHFELEVHVRKLHKNGVKLVSMTQEIGDDPIHAMMRHVIALFDEYQSKETAKHTIRALHENARQGFWNGPTPPTGYRIVVAEKRGTTIKRKLAVDPLYADTIRLIFHLALHGVGETGPLGIRRIAAHLNDQDIRSPSGGRWGLATVFRILRRRTYIGEYVFNQRSHSGRYNPESEIAWAAVPPIIDRETFDAVQRRLNSRSTGLWPQRKTKPASLLQGTTFCGKCGARLSVHVGGTGYSYYSCSARNQHGASACSGMHISAKRLDGFIISFVQERLLQPRQLAKMLKELLDHRGKACDILDRKADALNTAGDVGRRSAHGDQALEEELPAGCDFSIEERTGALRQRRNRYRRDKGAPLAVERAKLEPFATEIREKLKADDIGYRTFMIAVITKIIVRSDKIRIEGSRSELLAFITSGSAGAQSPNYGHGRLNRHSKDKFVFNVAHELRITQQKTRDE
ncbi:recombinase family protein [Sphingopyxis panaciterrae]